MRLFAALLCAVSWLVHASPADAQVVAAPWVAAPSAATPAAEARPARATNRLPSALADSTFWRLVTELSEPGGWFRSENYVSNETAWQYVIPSLARVVPAGHAYLGVGPEQNFTYLAALEPGIAFIVDIRRQNLALHLYYKALFELAATRAEFLSLLFARPLPSTGDLAADTARSAESLLQAIDASTMDSARHLATRSRVLAHLTERKRFVLNTEDRTLVERVADAFAEAGPEINYSYVPEYGPYTMVARGMPSFRTLFVQQDGAGVNRSFLGSEAAYQRVRAMQLRNLVLPVTGDFAGPHALRAVGEWLRAHEATVGTFYLSNVEQYLFQDNETWPRFYENVGTLPLDASSTFIRSVSSRWGRGATSSGAWGPLMSQLIGPMVETVDAFRAGAVRWYGDVIALVRP